jgi:hypothetical protein
MALILQIFINQYPIIMKRLQTISLLVAAFFSFQAFSQGERDMSLEQGFQDNSAGNSQQTEIFGTEEGVSDGVTFESMCDNFDLPNSTVVPGWTEQSGDWQIFNNTLKTPGVASWQYITLNGSTQTDGCITLRAKYSGTDQVQFIAAAGRYNSTSSCIIFKIQDNGDGAYWNSLWVYQNGQTGGTIFSITGQNYGLDAIIQMEYIGSSITIRVDTDRDGTWDHQHSATTSATYSGLCGIGAYNTCYADDYCCGDDCVYAVVPVSNLGIYLALLLAVGFVVIFMYRRA